MNFRWKRQKLDKVRLLALALVGLLLYSLAWWARESVPDPSYDLERAASLQAMAAFKAIQSRATDASLGMVANSLGSETAGLLGSETTPITTIEDPAFQNAKLTSINPNFAALIVKLLSQANVQEGDAVAIGMTGSFPALNLAALIACQTLRVHAIVITSLSASSWGANDPHWTWLDMESFLYDQGLIKFRSRAASLGGDDDNGEGLTEEGKQLLDEAIQRNDIPILTEDTLTKSIEKHWQTYERAARRPITAYINIGGGAASLGNPKAKATLKPGLNLRVPAGAKGVVPTGLAIRFLEHGVPVIHLAEVEELAKEYHMPLAPIQLPEPGTGKIFYSLEFSRTAVAILLGLYLLLLAAALHLDWRIPKSDSNLRQGGRK
ncbi:poly-gamma-glutamate system protein [Candidatus Acetothermia bacterium]|nr:poly-gamma-glutamate system protein [Candidatus Acetothermia bacterium]